VVEGITREVTEKFKVQKALEESEAKFRIITAIIGHAQLMSLKMKKNSLYKKAVDEILKASQRAAELTQQLLIFGLLKWIHMGI